MVQLELKLLSRKRQTPMKLYSIRPHATAGHSLLALWAMAFVMILSVRGADPPAQAAPADPALQHRTYRDFAMGHDGDSARGKLIFNDPRRAACITCHSVDGASSKTGPDLAAGKARSGLAQDLVRRCIKRPF